MSSNFDEKIPLIKEKFIETDYPLRFINRVVNEFQKGKECADESFIILASLSKIAQPFVFVEVRYCNSFRMVMTWKTRNIRSLFPLKDKIDYKLCVIYKGDSSCGSRYVSEIKRNARVRWNEHNNPTKS